MRIPRFPLDRATVAGLVLSAGSILAGMALEGGKIGDLLQITAGLIVLGGTAGAVLVSCPPPVFWRALCRAGKVLRHERAPSEALIERLVACSAKARKQGMLALESEAGAESDPFLRKALTLAVDGVGLDVIRGNMELEITLEEGRLEEEARVFEAAGGYAPTVGIIGAVLGLIQVMKHLDNIPDVGHGIAVAFVSTVYGVGLANLVLLPVAGKLRAIAAQQIQMYELVLEGVIGIAEGQNPKLIRNKLEAYVEGGLLDSEPERPPAQKRAFIVKQAAR